MPKHTLLVVDDEPDVIKSVKGLFRLDYRVLGASTAAEGLEIMQRETVDTVLSDQRMEGMSGVEFLSKLRVEYPDSTRLLFTAYTDVTAVVDAINEGSVYRYIAKPWEPKELGAILKDACALHDLIVERKQLLDELQKKNAELTQSNELKSAFIRVAGHELRTPLAILSGLSQLAAHETGTPEPLNGYIQGMGEATTRLERQVLQILKMLSAASFGQIFDRKSHEIGPLLNQAASDIAPFVRLRNQKIDVDIADDLGTIEADADKLRDCVNQLLLNAVKFTPDGGHVRLSARRSNGSLRISVGDDGSGIAPEALPRIFDPFFTAFDVSRHSSGQYEHQRRGLGLGLSIVKAFSEMHGGQVDVESEVGKGSTFTIVLPEAAKAAARAA
jgi:signal transduction histidine kinase